MLTQAAKLKLMEYEGENRKTVSSLSKIKLHHMKYTSVKTKLRSTTQLSQTLSIDKQNKSPVDIPANVPLPKFGRN